MTRPALRKITVSGSDGLKGQRFQESLHGIDVFAGSNGAGKSTRLLAVLAALRGLAETPNDAVRDYLGPTRPLAVVDLDFDGAPRLTRQLQDSPRTSASKQADGLAAGLVGPHLVRWDLADLSAATDADRTKVLQRVCDLAAGEQKVPDELRNHPELAGIRESDPGAWIKAANKRLSDRLTETNAAAKAAQPAAPESAELFGTAAEAEAEHRAAVLALSEIRGSIRAREAAVRERAALEVPVPEGPGPVVSVADARSALVGAEAAVMTRAAALKQAREPEGDRGVPGDVRKLTDERDAAREARTSAERELDAARRPKGKCRSCGCEDPLGTGTPIDVLERRVRAKSLLLAEATSRLLAAERAAEWARYEAARAAIPADRSAEIPGLRAALARAEAAQARDRLAALPELPPDRSAELAAAEARVAEAATRRDAHLTAAAAERAFQAALTRRDQAVASLETVKRLQKTLAALEKQLLAAGFPAIARAANAVLELADIGLRVEFRYVSSPTKKEEQVLDFGALRSSDGAYVSWWSLSDGERAVVGAALGVAFAQLGQARWRAVFLDGFEAVDADRRAGLLRALVELRHQGEVDNVLVGLWADSVPEVPEGVVVHWLGPVAARVEAA